MHRQSDIQKSLIRKPSRHAVAAVLVYAAAACFAGQPVRVTALSAPEHRHSFDGFGFNVHQNHFGYPHRNPTNWLSDDRRELLLNLIYTDSAMGSIELMRIQGVRIRAESNAMLLSQWDRTIRERLQAHPRMKLLFSAVGPLIDEFSYADRCAEVIELFENNYGIVIDYAGVGNEPNQHEDDGAVPIPAHKMPDVIKAMRRAFDKRGLTHVKVIGPGASNVDSYFWSSVEAVIADKEALDALYAWEYHSYNMSLIEDTYRWLKSTGKPIWQTESGSAHGDQDKYDSMSAAQVCVRFLADMNFGVNIWTHFKGASRLWEGLVQNNVAGINVISVNDLTGEFKVNLKYYYMRMLSRTFRTGTIIRKCTTDVHLRMAEKGFEPRAREKFMEYTYGLKIPLAASVGVRPDGAWIMGAMNFTGMRFEDFGSSYYPTTEFDVTFSVEELADSSGMPFTVWRINNGTRNADAGIIEDTVIMRNGEVTVPVRQCDLVCLSSKGFDTDFMTVPEIDFQTQTEGGSCGNCGSGLELVLMPPVILRITGSLRSKRTGRRKNRC